MSLFQSLTRIRKCRNVRGTSRPIGSKARRSLIPERLEDRTLMSTYMVTNLADHGTGSLRQAVLNANAHPGADVISFASSANGTIALTTGQITVNDSVTINGNGASKTIISGTT